MPGQDRHRQDRLRLLAVRLLDVAPQQQVELLVGPPQLDVGVDRHRVVSLEQRIEQLEYRDRLLRCVALREVVALEELRHRRGAREPEELLHLHREPLAVEAHLGAVRVEDLERLLLERLGVAVDLLRRQHGPLGRAPAGVSHARGVIADDQDDRVAAVLKFPQFA